MKCAAWTPPNTYRSFTRPCDYMHSVVGKPPLCPGHAKEFEKKGRMILRPRPTQGG